MRRAIRQTWNLSSTLAMLVLGGWIVVAIVTPAVDVARAIDHALKVAARAVEP